MCKSHSFLLTDSNWAGDIFAYDVLMKKYENAFLYPREWNYIFEAICRESWSLNIERKEQSGKKTRHKS